MSKRIWGLTLVVFSVLACLLLVVPAFADSQVRIVRLSDVEGSVQIDRATSEGYEKAFLNLPVTQGVKLKTEEDGRAEVEFEDGSTLRITPNTVVEFPELSLRDSGTKASMVLLLEGTAYVNYRGEKDSELTVNFGQESVRLTEAAHFRVQVNNTEAVLAVFKGNVEATGPSGNVEVGKKQSLTFDLTDSDRYTLAKSIEEDPFDAWDKEQEQYHDQYLQNSSYGNASPYGYGVSDLNYYGNYFNVPGYGLMWQPYFAGMGWDPFMNGAWVYYPGFGYTWVSAYPWGWMPYRYGSWLFLPGYGWCWQPGNSWAGWNRIPHVNNPPRHFKPPQPPTSPGRPVVVRRGPVTTLPAVSPRKMMIQNDSAGLGIARGSIHNLGKISDRVKTEGSATVTIRPLPVPASGSASSQPASTGSSQGSVGATPSTPRATPPPARSVSTPRMSTPTPAPRPSPSPRTSPKK
jgi:hypothetical protein